MVIDQLWRTAGSQVERAATAVRSWAATKYSAVSALEIAKIRDLLRGDHVAANDYDSLGLAFAAAFQEVNFAKCTAALNTLKPRRTDTIVDLGCGSAAAAAAAVAYLNSAFGADSVSVLLVDRSSRQLDLAKEQLRVVGTALKLTMNVSTLEGVLPVDSAPHRSTANALVLASHVLTENKTSVSNILRMAEEWAGPGGDVVIVERSDDPVWLRVDNYVQESLAVRSAGRSEVAALENGGPRTTWSTRWLKLARTSHPASEDAARRYFDAWKSRRTKRLVDVFTQDAHYHDKPPAPPIVGLKGIEKYWEEHVVEQEQLAIDFRSVGYTDTSVYIEWTASFVRHGLPRELHGTMVLEVDQHSGLVTELREYYRSAPPEVACDSERRYRSDDRRG